MKNPSASGSKDSGKLGHVLTASRKGSVLFLASFMLTFRQMGKKGLSYLPVNDQTLRLHQCTFFTRGSMTFKEAYMRTGRILNISVIPADRHS